MTSEALSRGARGAGITVVSQLASMAIQFVGAVILARMLSPSDFGLVAMVAVFVALGELLRDFGMPTAALQARTLSAQQGSNMFWASVVLSAVAGGLLCLAAPLIVLLYDEEKLALIVPAMAIALLLNGVQAQYQVRLAREMRFASLAATTVAAKLGGLVVAVLGASAGWSYWALVAQQVAGSAFLLLLGLAVTRWIPRLPKRDGQTAALLRSGAHFGGAQALTFASDNVDTVMIGSIWGANALGQYNRAFQLFMAPLAGIFGPLTRVVVPTINGAVEEGRSAEATLLRMQTVLCGATIWVLLVTSVSAPWLIPFLLGERWSSIVPLVQILAVAGVFRALSQTNYWAYVVSHNSRQLFYSNLVTKPIQIALIVGAAFVGIEAVAWAYVLGRAVTWPINLVWLQRVTGQSAQRFGVNGVRLIVASGLSYAVTTAVLNAGSPASEIAGILIGFSVATVVYVVVIAVLPGGWRELQSGYRVLRELARLRSGGSAA